MGAQLLPEMHRFAPRICKDHNDETAADNPPCRGCCQGHNWMSLVGSQHQGGHPGERNSENHQGCWHEVSCQRHPVTAGQEPE